MTESILLHNQDDLWEQLQLMGVGEPKTPGPLLWVAQLVYSAIVLHLPAYLLVLKKLVTILIALQPK